MMKTKDIKKGISLIVLIVTIIVVIILAAVVILTLSKNNPIESAKEARFKEDVRTFQDELALTVSKQYTTAGGHRDEKITTSDFNAIKEYIPSFSEKYKDKFIIQDDELVYTKQLDDIEKEYEYQQVEYIVGKNQTTAYIDTEFAPNQNSHIRITGSNYGWMFQVRKNISNMTFGVIYTREGTFRSDFGIEEKNTKAEDDFDYSDKVICDKNRNVTTISNGTRTITIINQSVTFQCDRNYLINATNTEKGITSCVDRPIYACRIWDNEKMIRDFVPCYHIADNIVGLYDIVNGKFYTSYGTGDDFIAGPDVNE